MARILLGLVCIALVAMGCDEPRDPVASATISGPITVLDGDTIEIGATRIRLFGIDAVEHDQTCRNQDGTVWACGDWVTQQARAQFQGRNGRCEPTGDVTYGRIVARCTVGGTDMQRALVDQGMAFAYRRYSSDYVGDERTAAAQKRGIWAGTVQKPEEFRAASKTSGCRIKGNVSASGNIYHLPGSDHYARTRINTARGERWFCSVAEAEQAGWRAARG
jgi:endonuclease YncB( thermonuclease family)